MFESLSKLRLFWNSYGFEIVLGLTVLTILILALINRGKKGTWFRYNIVKKNDKPISKPKDSRGETETRRVLEKIFKKPFPKIRPNWLRNDVTSNIGYSNNLEIDAYNDELKLGVEYQGVQHYKFSPYFHKTKDAFHNQKYRDELKRRMCADNKVKLLEVSYEIKLEDIENYIRKELGKMGYGRFIVG
jgi:hypothetical protein